MLIVFCFFSPSSARTFSVTRIAGLEESVNADEREHGNGSDHGAQLHHRPAPHEGTVALVPQDHPDDDLHVGQGQDEQDPGDHLTE